MVQFGPDAFLNLPGAFSDGMDVVAATPVRVEGVNHGEIHPNKVNPSQAANIYGHALSLDLSLIFIGVAAGLFYMVLQEYQDRQAKNKSSLPFLFLQVARLVAEQTAIRDYYETIALEEIDDEEDKKGRAAAVAQHKNFHSRKQLAAFKTQAKGALKEDKSHAVNFINQHKKALQHELVEDQTAKGGYKWKALGESAGEESAAAAVTQSDKEADPKEKNQNDFGRVSAWFDKMENKTWVSRGLAPAWKAIVAYSMFFWIAWFVCWVAIGTSPVGVLANALVFGVPLVPIVGYAIAKSMETYRLQKAKKAGKEKARAGDEPAEDQEALAAKEAPLTEKHVSKLHRKLFAQLVHHEYGDTFEVKKSATKRFLAKLFGASVNDAFESQAEASAGDVKTLLARPALTKAEELPSEVQRLQKGYGRRMVISGLSSFMDGYLSFFFASWPPTAFLTTFTTPIGQKLMHIFGGFAFQQVTFGLCVAMGTFYAVKGVAAAHKEYKTYEARIQEKATDLKQYEQLKRQNASLKATLELRSQEVREFIDRASWSPDQKGDARALLEQQKLLSTSDARTTFISNPTVWERFKATTVKVLEPTLLAFARFGTGFLITRTLFYLGSGFLAFALASTTPVGWAVVGVGFGLGVAWAALKIYQNYQAAKDKKAQELVDHVDEHVDLLEKEQIELSHQLTHLNAFQKTAQAENAKANDVTAPGSVVAPAAEPAPRARAGSVVVAGEKPAIEKGRPRSASVPVNTAALVGASAGLSLDEKHPSRRTWKFWNPVRSGADTAAAPGSSPGPDPHASHV